jgi:hypothetical protein
LENELGIGGALPELPGVQYFTTIEDSDGVMTVAIHERTPEGVRILALLTCAPDPVGVLGGVLRGLLAQVFPLV